MADIVIEHVTTHARRSVRFAIDASSTAIECFGETPASPSFAVFSFDAERDLAYRVPVRLSAFELEGEVQIHFPEQLVELLGQRPLVSQLGESVLIQPVISVATRLSPLTALNSLLARISDVNSAILHCENGAMMLVRRAGQEVTVHFSSESLETFLELPKESREQHFPDFDALEVFLTGADAQTSQRVTGSNFPLEKVRLLRLADIAPFVKLDDTAIAEVSGREPLYCLPIAAALLLLDITKDMVG